MKVCIKAYLLLSAMVLFTGFAPAHAQAVNKLTDNKIRAYYADFPDLFKKPYAKFLENYDQRIHPDLEYISKTTLILPGQAPMQTEPVTVKKADLIGNAQRAYDTAKGADLSNDITKVTIAEDGKSATVSSMATVKGMNFPTSDDSPMKADSVETCEDVVTLSDGAIQLLKSTCTAEVQIIQ